MAVMTVNVITRDGGTPTKYTPQAAGDEFLNTGEEFVLIQNDDTSDATVTFDIVSTVDGQTVSDRVDSVPSGSVGNPQCFGPFPPAIYNNSNGRVKITISGITLDNAKISVYRLS